MRSPGPTPWKPLLAALVLALPLAGCLAGEGAGTTLSVSSGAGDLVVYLVLDQGTLTRGDAWWAQDAPELDLQVARGPGWDALILKNDVQVDRLPVLGTAEKAFVVWHSADKGVVASAGDELEVLVVDGDDVTATFRITIEP